MPRTARNASAGAAAAAGPERSPRWSQIARDLAASIENGLYPDGTSLPSATAVADRYGVHRHTARQAFRHLQDLGLVSVERGRGTIVTGRRFPYRIGRRVSFRANLGAAGVPAAGEVIACMIAEAGPETARVLRIEPGAPVWEVRMVSRAAGAPVSTSVHWLDAGRFPGFGDRIRDTRASTTAAFRGYGIEDYVRLSTRLTARTPTAGERRLLQLRRGAPVLQSSAIDGLADGTPLQLVVSAFAADRVEFVIEADPGCAPAARRDRAERARG